MLTEAAAVEPRGRISPQDLGLWRDEHQSNLNVDGLRRITTFIGSQGAVPGIQLAHAGRKASTFRPWSGRRGAVPSSEQGWRPIGPNAAPFEPDDPPPLALDDAGIAGVIEAFRAASRRALEAGFRVIEIHGAHGYLLHSFLSPLANTRSDGYGGAFENRTRCAQGGGDGACGMSGRSLPSAAGPAVEQRLAGGGRDHRRYGSARPGPRRAWRGT